MESKSAATFLRELDDFFDGLPLDIQTGPRYEIILDETTGRAYLKADFVKIRWLQDFFLRRRIHGFFKDLLIAFEKGEYNFYNGELLLHVSDQLMIPSTFWKAHSKRRGYVVKLFFTDGLSIAGFPDSSAWLIRKIHDISPEEFNRRSDQVKVA